MEDTVRIVAQSIAVAAEALAVAFISFGMLGALAIALRGAFSRGHGYAVMRRCRIYLGHYLSIALEFLIGADILMTAIAPSWEDIGKLAAIVGVRTVLNFFLSRELREMESFPDRA